MSNHLFSQVRERLPAAERTFLATPAGRRISYGELVDATGAMANALVAQGVLPGDRVAVQVDKSPEAIVLYLACVRAGAVFLPLNTAYTLNELDYFIGDAQPALVVCRPQDLDAIGGLAAAHGVRRTLTLGADGDGTLLDAARDRSAEFGDTPRGPDDLAAMLYTSGTTGRSKGAMLTHENLASNARTLVAYWRFGRDDVLLHALPIFHTHGLFVATNTILFSGAAMLFLPRFDAAEVMRLLPRVTTLMGVPTFYTRLLQEPALDRESTRHMRLFVSGSAPLLAETHERWQERTGHAVLERYGMTETNMNTSNPYDGPRIAGTVGRPLPGVELRVVDQTTGRPVADGEVGIIEVRGPNVFQGYWRMPEKTAAEFRPDGYFITGDLGRIGAHGHVQIVGRAKDLVITGGYNVYPKEIEEAIDALDGVVESAVIGLAHPDLGEAVTAVIVAGRGTGIDAAGVLAALSDRLARYKQPRAVLFVDELPRNAMGKVQKNLLRERFAGRFDRSA